MKLSLFTIIFYFIAISKGLSSPQVSDLIIINNDTLPLYSLPLEKYLNENNISPNIFDNYGFSTGCYRSYRAIWKLQNDSLFLVALNSCLSDSINIPFSLIFEDDILHNNIFANWLTDTLWIETGNKIFYDHIGWGWYYDREKAIKISKGVAINITEYDYSHKIFISEINTDNFSLKDHYCKKINWENIPVPESEIKIIVNLNSDTSYVIHNMNYADKIYENEALRVLSTLKTTTLYQFGEEINLTYSIPIIFSKEIKNNCKGK